MNTDFFDNMQHNAVNEFFQMLTTFQFPEFNDVIIDIEDIV